jgi:hypothetical protein
MLFLLLLFALALVILASTPREAPICRTERARRRKPVGVELSRPETQQLRTDKLLLLPGRSPKQVGP